MLKSWAGLLREDVGVPGSKLWRSFCCEIVLVMGSPRAYANIPLGSQGELTQAEPIYKRAQDILEKSLGRDHPEVAEIIKSRAGLVAKVRSCRRFQQLNLQCTVLLEFPVLNSHGGIVESAGENRRNPRKACDA